MRMRFGVELPNHGGFGDIGLLRDLAAEAEESGWDGVFVWDSLYASRWDRQWPDEARRSTVDPWIVLAAMATVTRRVRLGPMITPLARRRPWKVARETTTLDHLSGGRLVLGVGLGSPDDGAFGMVGEAVDRATRAARLDESLAILDGLWSGAEFSFHGKHHTVEAMTFLPRPVQRPRIPVWVVAAWPRPRSLARAARWDGALPIRMDGSGLPAPAPDDVRALCADLGGRRGGLTGYDIVAWDARPFPNAATEAARAAEFAAAGATWWIDPAWKWMTRPDAVDSLRRRIRSGPPVA
jgi:alkanesulfonate monooxygenase SsuD/methylene tetrahydromethanopterin reductase-like flavin-dependent oxidoreductase (luciferase family)